MSTILQLAKDKTVLITGSTDGVGRFIAAELGRAGARVLVHGRNRERAEHLVDEITAAGGAVDFGPFSSTCQADDGEMPGVVAALLTAAFEHGATHVRLSVDRIDEDQT